MLHHDTACCATTRHVAPRHGMLRRDIVPSSGNIDRLTPGGSSRRMGGSSSYEKCSTPWPRQTLSGRIDMSSFQDRHRIEWSFKSVPVSGFTRHRLTASDRADRGEGFM